MRQALAVFAVSSLCLGCGQPPVPVAQLPAATTKPAPDLTVFGLQLGKPLKLPKCPADKDAPLCRDGDSLLGNTLVQVRGLANSSTYNPYIEVTEIDGRAEIITVNVYDRRTAEEDAASDLGEKYGSPHRYGKDADLSEWASWDFDDLSVFYIGSGLDISRALILFETPVGTAHSAAEAKSRDAATPKL